MIGQHNPAKTKKQTDRNELTKKNCKIKEDIRNFMTGKEKQTSETCDN
jgi:hypothetical protein